MKRFIVACQIAIAALFIIKILFWSETLRVESTWPMISLDPVGQAIAQTTKPATAPEVKDVLDDPLKKERDLLASLQKRQKELDVRESDIKAEEQKVLGLKREVMEKIDALKALETQLSSKLDVEKNNDSKRLKELAKVYEATPPPKAAAMLEKLDVRTAAGITINMKRERAGLIWGHLTPQKAVAITQEITRTAQSAAE